jgi:hypothetical protein
MYILCEYCAKAASECPIYPTTNDTFRCVEFDVKGDVEAPMVNTLEDQNTFKGQSSVVVIAFYHTPTMQSKGEYFLTLDKSGGTGRYNGLNDFLVWCEDLYQNTQHSDLFTFTVGFTDEPTEISGDGRTSWDEVRQRIVNECFGRNVTLEYDSEDDVEDITEEDVEQYMDEMLLKEYGDMLDRITHVVEEYMGDNDDVYEGVKRLMRYAETLELKLRNK